MCTCCFNSNLAFPPRIQSPSDDSPIPAQSRAGKSRPLRMPSFTSLGVSADGRMRQGSKARLRCGTKRIVHRR